MSVVHRIIGYDKQTEFVAQEFEVPADGIAEVRKFAKVDPGVGEIVGAYPLDRSAAQSVKERFNFGMWLDSCDWFFEPFGV